MRKVILPYILALGTLCWSIIQPKNYDHEVCGSWKRYGNSCYMRVYDKLKHADADISCRASGAFLVEIDDDLEQRFVFEHLAMVPYAEGVWTGLVRVTDGPKWTWNGRKPLKYQFWGYGEPNDYMERGEKCSEMRYWDGMWNDVLCLYKFGYICEKEIQVGHPTVMSTDVSRIDGALTGHVIQVTNASGVMDCYDKCQAIPQCLSFNYQHSSSNLQSVCELNNSTRGLVGQSFVAREGFTYYD